MLLGMSKNLEKSRNGWGGLHLRDIRPDRGTEGILSPAGAGNAGEGLAELGVLSCPPQDIQVLQAVGAVAIPAVAGKEVMVRFQPSWQDTGMGEDNPQVFRLEAGYERKAVPVLHVEGCIAAGIPLVKPRLGEIRPDILKVMVPEKKAGLVRVLPLERDDRLELRQGLLGGEPLIREGVRVVPEEDDMPPVGPQGRLSPEWAPVQVRYHQYVITYSAHLLNNLSGRAFHIGVVRGQVSIRDSFPEVLLEALGEHADGLELLCPVRPDSRYDIVVAGLQGDLVDPLDGLLLLCEFPGCRVHEESVADGIVALDTFCHINVGQVQELRPAELDNLRDQPHRPPLKVGDVVFLHGTGNGPVGKVGCGGHRREVVVAQGLLKAVDVVVL